MSKTMKHLPQWDGERKTFQVWWTRFQSYAALQGWAVALKEDFERKLPMKEEGAFDANDSTVAASQEAAVKMNQEAVLAFVMAFTSDRCMSVYYSTQCEDWPNGVAWKVAKAIRDEYQPRDRISLVEFGRRLSEVTMTDTDEPKVLFEQLASIRNMFKDAAFSIHDEDLIAVVMEKAPRKYASVMTVVQATKGDNLCLQDISKVMNDLYRMDMSNLKLDNKETKKEVVLGAVDGIKCYTCGKSGHKSYQCKSGKGNKQGEDAKKSKFKGTCNQCG